MTHIPKLLSGVSVLTPADVHMLLMPSFWRTPLSSDLAHIRQPLVVAFLAFAGLSSTRQSRLTCEEVHPNVRRIDVAWRNDQWTIPITPVTAHLLRRYQSVRDKLKPATETLFVLADGSPAQQNDLFAPLTSLGRRLGTDKPIPDMLLDFFCRNVELYPDPDVVLAYNSQRHPGERHPPVVSIRQMETMINETDVMGPDLRSFANDSAAMERINALGGTPLPRCRWEIPRIVEPKPERKLANDHPIVRHLTDLNIPKGHAGTQRRETVFDSLMPEIDKLLLSGEMPFKQAAELFGYTHVSFLTTRQLWKDGNGCTAAGRAALIASKPKPSYKYPRPALTREERRTLKALNDAKWPRVRKKSLEFRDRLISEHFALVAKIIKDRNLLRKEAARLFRVPHTTITDLLNAQADGVSHFANKTMKSGPHSRPALNAEEHRTLTTLRDAKWPRGRKEIGEFRDRLIDEHFALATKMIEDGNLSQRVCARFFQISSSTLADLLNARTSGVALATRAPTDPFERQRIVNAIQRALATRSEGESIVKLTRRVRADTNLPVSYEFVQTQLEAKPPRTLCGTIRRAFPRHDSMRKGTEPRVLLMLRHFSENETTALSSIMASCGYNREHVSKCALKLERIGYLKRKKLPPTRQREHFILTSSGLIAKNAVLETCRAFEAAHAGGNPDRKREKINIQSLVAPRLPSPTTPSA